MEILRGLTKDARWGRFQIINSGGTRLYVGTEAFRGDTKISLFQFKRVENQYHLNYSQEYFRLWHTMSLNGAITNRLLVLYV